jgi:excisionase family DNA binding protein
MVEDKLHDIPSAAEYLGGVSVWSVRAWLSQGRLTKTKVGRRTMIRQSELERFIARENE